MLILDSLEIKPAKLLVALESDNAPAPLRQGEEDRPKDFAKVWADINADDVTQDPKLEAEVEGVALPIAEGEETLSEAIPQTQAKEGVEGNPLAQSVRLPTLNAEPKPVTILPTPQQEGIVEEKRGGRTNDLEKGKPNPPIAAAPPAALVTAKVVPKDTGSRSDAHPVPQPQTIEHSPERTRAESGEVNTTDRTKSESNQPQDIGFQRSYPEKPGVELEEKQLWQPAQNNPSSDGELMAHPDQEKKVLPVQLVATPAASIEPSVRPDKVTSELDRPPAPRPITVAHTETVERAPLQAPAVAPTSAILPPSPERPVTPDTPITAKEYTAPLPIHVLSEQPPKSPTEAPTIENEAPLARDAKVRDVPPPPPSFTPRPQQKVDMNVPTPAPLVQVSEIKKLTPTGLTSVEPELALFNAPTTTHHQPRPITTLPSTHAPQVAAQIASAVAQIGSGTTQILLNPEELGRVRLTLTTTEHGIAVSVAAERPETIDLMRRHVDLLVQEFDDLDQGSIDLQFQQNDSNSGKTDSNSNYSSAALEDDKTQIAPPTTILSATPSGGLDLKL